MSIFLNLNENDAAHSDEFYRLLKNSGLAFPDNREELDRFIDLIKKYKHHVPAPLSDPSIILKTGLLNLTRNFNAPEVIIVEENMARAAREGNKIPDKILKKMETDRLNSKNKNNNDKAGRI